jgi:two-component system, chemotaxis family, sensor kinase CheA
MDVSEYLPMFLAEGREHLQELNLALVQIEQDPSNGETINQIFRVAHTLKGMSATMGFTGMAALTHEMESVMEGMRSGPDGLVSTALDTLFKCLDTLEGMVDEIEEGGEETSDVGPLVAVLSGLLSKTGEAAVHTEDAGGPSGEVVAARAAAGLPVLHFSVTLADDVDMPGVRAYLAVRAAEEHGDIVHCDPAYDVVERGEIDGTTIDIWLATAADDQQIASSVRGVEGVADCKVEAPGKGPGETAVVEVVAEPTPVLRVVADAPAPGDAAAADGAPGDAAGTHPGKARSQTVRIEADRLDLLMHMMGEMVVQRTRVEAVAAESASTEMQAAVNDLSRVSQSLQQLVMQVRMVPVESVLMRFPRMVRDIAGKLGKQVHLEIAGAETELDRTVVEALGDPLVHLVRNAMDHGLETPEERVAGGKEPTGTLTIAAEHAGGEVLIHVSDDGRGVDPAKVGAIAASRGMLAPELVDSLSVAAAIELLFAPGFSTTAVATDLSGRGVGMDAVRTMVRNLGGDCSLVSTLGAGSRATIRLPLSLAILPALLVSAAGAPYALPLDRVEETIRLSNYTVRSVAGSRAIVLRDSLLQLVDLGAALGGSAIDPTRADAVVVRSGGDRFGLLVDDLIGQKELVTRPLPRLVEVDSALVSGGAILGDGTIALILNLESLRRSAVAA